MPNNTCGGSRSHEPVVGFLPFLDCMLSCGLHPNGNSKEPITEVGLEARATHGLLTTSDTFLRKFAVPETWPRGYIRIMERDTGFDLVQVFGTG